MKSNDQFQSMQRNHKFQRELFVPFDKLMTTRLNAVVQATNNQYKGKPITTRPDAVVEATTKLFQRIELIDGSASPMEGC